MRIKRVDVTKHSLYIRVRLLSGAITALLTYDRGNYFRRCKYKTGMYLLDGVEKLHYLVIYKEIMKKK